MSIFENLRNVREKIMHLFSGNTAFINETFLFSPPVNLLNGHSTFWLSDIDVIQDGTTIKLIKICNCNREVTNLLKINTTHFSE